jgi:hypothetical protein
MRGGLLVTLSTQHSQMLTQSFETCLRLHTTTPATLVSWVEMPHLVACDRSRAEQSTKNTITHHINAHARSASPTSS